MRLAEIAVQAIGPIDLLVCNAGIASGEPSVALPEMWASDRADVIVISSSEVGAAGKANSATHNMAKAALEALARTLANEKAVNRIRVNIVAPGLVVTDAGVRLINAVLHVDDPAELDARPPSGRVRRPADVAHSCGCWLRSTERW
jgi:3-oxoacyl-[acyl-carrier protein] reductase